MKVRCTQNRRDSLPSEALKRHSSDELFPLVIGKEYNVFALTEFDGYVWYCVLDEHHSRTMEPPIWWPFPLFEISDSRSSCFWIFSFTHHSQGKIVPYLSFPEWVNTEYFYGNLIESQEEEVAIFENYRKSMDLKFPNTLITEKAEVSDDKWLICPGCVNAWQEPSRENAMVICPKCNKLLHNPRYIDELLHC